MNFKHAQEFGLDCIIEIIEYLFSQLDEIAEALK